MTSIKEILTLPKQMNFLGRGGHTFRFQLCQCLSGLVHSVCRPQDVTYILKGMTNSFQIWIFPKCLLFILKCIRLKHFLSFASFLIAEWLQLTLIVVVDFGPNANSVA